MNKKFSGIRISEISTCIPSNRFEVSELANIYGAADIDRLIETNGISKVCVAKEGTCASDLCVEAAQAILANSESKPDALIFVSQTPDYIMPATGPTLQHRLGLDESCVTFDINSGCTGYVMGLLQASLLVSSGTCSKVLLLAGDVITTHLSEMDKASRAVFGDGGSATLIESGEDDISFSVTTNGAGAEHLMIKAGCARHPIDEDTGMVDIGDDGEMHSDEDLFLNGLEVMNYALAEVPKSIQTLFETSGWTKDELGTVYFHQANKFIVNYLRKIMKLPKDKTPITMEHTGNTGPVSIPLSISQSSESIAKESLEKTLLVGFGVGLTVASAALNLSATKIHPIIEIP